MYIEPLVIYYILVCSNNEIMVVNMGTSWPAKQSVGPKVAIVLFGTARNSGCLLPLAFPWLP